MTYYVQPVDPAYSDPTTNWEGYGLASLGWDQGGNAQNIVGSGPQLNYSSMSPDDMMYYGGGSWGDISGSNQRVDSGQNDLYGYEYGAQDYSDFGGGFNPWGPPSGSGGIQYDPNVGYEYGYGNDSYNPNVGYEYGDTFDPYGYGTGQNANYGYDYGYGDGGRGTSYLDDLSSRYNTPIGDNIPRTGNQIDLQTGGIPRVSKLGSGSSWTENRGSSSGGGRPPPPPQSRGSSSLPPQVSVAHIPLPDVRPVPGAPNYNIMAQPNIAWNRLQNFLDDPTSVLQSDPMYNAILGEGNRNLAGQHRRGRTRFSGTAGAQFEKFGAETAAQNLDRIAKTYGETARDELARWMPQAQLDFNRQTQGYNDALDAWRAGTSADFQRYGMSQGDVRNLIAANQLNVENRRAYDSDLGAQDMMNYMYNLQNFYGY